MKLNNLSAKKICRLISKMCIRDSSYTGTTFPGGHVEQNEIFQKSMIREVLEETGLTIETPKLCGLYHWHKGGVHYVITLYLSLIHIYLRKLPRK